MTLRLPVNLGCPQVSVLGAVAIGRPPTSTEPGLGCVLAAQWLLGLGQGGCGLTGALIKAIGRPLTNTAGLPFRITPPAVLTSPTLQTKLGIPYPKINFLLGRLIPVVVSVYLALMASSVSAYMFIALVFICTVEPGFMVNTLGMSPMPCGPGATLNGSLTSIQSVSTRVTLPMSSSPLVSLKVYTSFGLIVI